MTRSPVCPGCRRVLHFIEVGESNDDEIKRIYSCHHNDCEIHFVYTYQDVPTYPTMEESMDFANSVVDALYGG